MNQEDKDLLILDLCERLPYEVKVNINSEYLNEGLIKAGYNKPLVAYGITADGSTSFTLDKSLMSYNMPILSVKPYLFPLSSMTEEQKKFFKDKPIFLDSENELVVKEDFFGNSRFTMLDDWMEVIDWLNKNHFDYRGLIPKGLAIDATGLNIY